MSNFELTRREMLKAAGVGLAALAGVTHSGQVATAHPSIDAPAPDFLGPLQVPANSDAGFNYPYFLYLPETSQTEPVPMLVEPNNTGTATDDFGEHRSAAKQFIEGRLGWTRTYSQALATPLLVPVFPRPRSDPVDGTHYVHALDTETMRLEETDLERVDLQLWSMIEHAQELLTSLSYPVADDVMLNGFSASGNFVNRFTALHPEKVRSVTAGGINGTPILPIESASGHTLDYQIGVADLEEITGDPFDAPEWRAVPQLLYMGGEDTNDTIPYDDAWSDRQRQIALDVYGEEMVEERMPYSEGVYADAGANATFEIYEGIGHRTPLEIQEDIADFHRREAELKQISFGASPTAGDTTVTVETLVYDSQRQMDVRVRSAERGDITDTAATVPTGESVEAAVSLTDPLNDGEHITGIVLPSDTADPERAVASVDQQARETPFLEVSDNPTESALTLTVSYGVQLDYQSSAPIHLYARSDGGGSQLLTTISPGTLSEGSYELSTKEFDDALGAGTELELSLADVDNGNTLATATATVQDGDSTAQDSPTEATVEFESQLTAGRDSLEIAYAIEADYEQSHALTLQLQIGDETNVLLDAPAPGQDTTETVSLKRIPTPAGQTIALQAVDRTTLSEDRSVIVKDTDGAVSLRFTDVPTEADPSATVEYQLEETYEAVDAITLRAYADGLPGASGGEPLTLLDSGAAGTETFTVGEDVATPTGDLYVGIIDDEPLAIASTDRSLEPASSAQSGQAGTEEAGTTGADGPGFGVSSAVAGASGLAYLLKRRLDDTDS